jgi:putative Mg2+ transporter-C (MgtC) family protein
MPLTLTWSEILLRLLCAVMIGGLLGLDRSEHGRVAGLRTSILVCVAACIAMLQVNLLLPLAGRAPDSFVMNDLMRLPLGILSGIGFIGAGAIVRRDNLVSGVTTAATIWFLTVLGLCFGGGHITLGLIGGAIGISVLSGLKGVENRMRRDRLGRLRIVIAADGPEDSEIRDVLKNEGFRVTGCGFSSSGPGEAQEMVCDLQWRARSDETGVPPVMRQLMARCGVTRVEWTPQAPLGS